MKKILMIFFIIALSLIFVNIYNNNPGVIISKLTRDGNMHSGELIYAVNLFGIIPFGEATFFPHKTEDYKGGKVYHLSAQAQNANIFSKLRRVSATAESYVDIQSRNPVCFKQRLSMAGSEDRYKEVFYDQKNCVVSIAGVKRQILPDTQDPLSAIFHIRQMDFDKIKNFEISLNTNQKNYVLRAKVKPRDIMIDNKVFKAYILEATISRRDKNPYHKSNIAMVLFKVEDNIPVFIKVFASGVFMTARLIDIK